MREKIAYTSAWFFGAQRPVMRGKRRFATVNNIILIGMMGAGKSAVGRLLAEKLQRRFCDVDSCIEKAAGMSIADIFANEGEYSLESESARR